MVAYCSIASAHQDTVFHIAKSGVLEGVPDDYSPVYITKEPPSNPNTLKIKLANEEVTLPPCIAKHFVNLRTDIIIAKGSWYHDPKLIPKYIIFSIGMYLPKTDWGYQWFVGHDLFFTLDTGEFFYFLEYQSPKDKSQFKKSINFMKSCNSDELESMKYKKININLEGTTVFHY